MASGWGSFLTGLSHTTQQLPALMQRQQALKIEEQRLEEKVKQDKVNQDWHIGGQLMQVMQNKNLPKSMRLEAYNNLRPVWERNGLGALPEMQAWDDTYSDVAKKAWNIHQDETLSKDLKLKGIRGLYSEAATKADRDEIKDVEQRTIIQGGEVPKEEQALLTKDQQNALKPDKPVKSVERTVDLGDKVEYIYTDGSRELKTKGRSPSAGGDTDELSKNIKMDKYHTQLTQQAMSQAGKEAGLKFNTNPTIQLGSDGKPTISFPNNPAAHEFYVKRVGELQGEKVKQAVKRKALSKDYMPEETSKPYSSAYQSRDEVKEAVQSGKITKEEGIKILQKDFGMK